MQEDVDTENVSVSVEEKTGAVSPKPQERKPDSKLDSADSASKPPDNDNQSIILKEQRDTGRVRCSVWSNFLALVCSSHTSSVNDEVSGGKWQAKENKNDERSNIGASKT